MIRLFSGPGYWGLMNPQWNMCSKGRRQSPINVETDKLLFDPFLRQIHLDKSRVSSCHSIIHISNITTSLSRCSNTVFIDFCIYTIICLDSFVLYFRGHFFLFFAVTCRSARFFSFIRMSA